MSDVASQIKPDCIKTRFRISSMFGTAIDGEDNGPITVPWITADVNGTWHERVFFFFSPFFYFQNFFNISNGNKNAQKGRFIIFRN